MAERDYHICLLGPTRCGKTTLLAAAVEEFMKFSEEVSRKDAEYIKIVPRNRAKGLINASIDVIKASTRMGEFYTQALEGTTDHTVYDFDVAYVEKKDDITTPNFSFHFHDFPGDWIKNDDERFKKIKFSEAQVLIMPVDASLIYEAVRPRHQALAASELQIASLMEVAKRWAQGRRADADHPGLFILAPVKCESYHNDNLPIGRGKDNSREMRDKIMFHFGELVKEIKAISPNTWCWYMPVDTVGCCFLNDKDWIKGENGMQFVAQYKIPQGHSWTPLGPTNIMLEIMEYLVAMNDKDKSWWETIKGWIGWDPDLVEKMKKMRAASDKKYKRGREL